MALFGAGSIYSVPFTASVTTAGSFDLIGILAPTNSQVVLRSCDAWRRVIGRNAGVAGRDRYLPGFDGVFNQRQHYCRPKARSLKRTCRC